MLINMFLIAAWIGQLVSFHDLSVKSCSGSDIRFADFKGKKVLVVNIASEHTLSDQIGDLETLYQRYHEHLVILAVPSGSFGKEGGSTSEVCNKLRFKYDFHFHLTAKSVVTGEGRIPLYQWIGSKDMNGLADIPIIGDFQKIMVDETGSITGIYSATEPVLGGAIEAAVSK